MSRSGGQGGFTLVEVLLSAVIIGSLAAISIPIYNSFAVRNDLDLATQQVVGTLRRAQTYARGVKEDSAWSVRVQATDVRLYMGTDFNGRTQSFDEPVDLPSSMTVSGLSDVQFAKLTAAPNTTGTITLTSTNNETRTITINAKGMVEY